MAHSIWSARISPGMAPVGLVINGESPAQCTEQALLEGPLLLPSQSAWGPPSFDDVKSEERHWIDLLTIFIGQSSRSVQSLAIRCLRQLGVASDDTRASSSFSAIRYLNVSSVIGLQNFGW